MNTTIRISTRSASAAPSVADGAPMCVASVRVSNWLASKGVPVGWCHRGGAGVVKLVVLGCCSTSRFGSHSCCWAWGRQDGWRANARLKTIDPYPTQERRCTAS